MKLYKGFPGGLVVKHSSAKAGDEGFISGFSFWVGRGNINPLPYSCLGNPWGCKALDMTEHLSAHTVSSTFSFYMKLYPLWTFNFLLHLQDSVFPLSYWVVSEILFLL